MFINQYVNDHPELEAAIMNVEKAAIDTVMFAKRLPASGKETSPGAACQQEIKEAALEGSHPTPEPAQQTSYPVSPPNHLSCDSLVASGRLQPWAGSANLTTSDWFTRAAINLFFSLGCQQQPLLAHIY